MNKKILIISLIFLILLFFTSFVSAADATAVLTQENTEIINIEEIEMMNVEDSSAETTQDFGLEQNFTGESNSISPNKIQIDSQQVKKILKENNNENLNEKIIKPSNTINLLSDTNEDLLTADIHISGNTIADINTAINNANSGDNIFLDGKTYTGFDAESFGNGILLGKDVNIYGGSSISDTRSATFDTQISINIIQVYTPNAIISNINFNNNGVAMSTGSAIRVTDSVKIINCKFTNFNTIDGSVITSLRGVHKTVIIHNCTFTNNQNNNTGAALKLYSDNAICSNCSFINNNAKFGGAIYWAGVNGTVSNCSFVNNTVIYDVNDNNSAEGGAIYWLGANGTVSTCNFENNSASHAGGAIRWQSVNGTLFDCNFTNNTSIYQAGALMWHDSNGNVFDCNFINNTAYYAGGAMTTFSELNNFTLFNCNFINNTAEKAGAIFWFSPNSRIVGCNFTNNVANRDGGGLWIATQSFNSTFVDCSFINNTATNRGGGILIRGKNITLSYCILTNNNATDGGAVYYMSGTNVTIKKSTFTNNNASNKGGAIYLDENAVNSTFSNSIFIDNKCRSESLVLNYNSLTFRGNENYINAIWSVNQDINFENVTFWNGSVVNSDDVDPIKSTKQAGINITLEIYDSKGVLQDNVTSMTNASGQIFYDFSKININEYTYKAYHKEDNYYTYIEITGIIKKYNIIILNNQTIHYNNTQKSMKINATIQDSETKNTINPSNIKLLFIYLHKL